MIIVGLFGDNLFMIIISILFVWFCVEFWNSVFVFFKVLFRFGDLMVDNNVLLMDFLSFVCFVIGFVNGIFIIVDELNIINL